MRPASTFSTIQLSNSRVFGVWIAMIIDWCFRAILFVYRYFSGKWQGRSAV